MSTITGTVFRRGAELAAVHLKREPSDDQPRPSPWMFGLFGLTVVAISLTVWAVQYTLGNVVATLAAVEDTNPDIYVRIDNNEDDPNKPINPNEPEMAGSTPLQPITNKLRTTVRHLRARAGFWSPFRGLSLFLVYSLARGFISGLLPTRGSFLGQFLVQSCLSMLLATWQMAWVHIVISERSPKPFYQRIPSYRTWPKIAPAVALQDILTAAGFFLPLAALEAVGLIDFETPQNEVTMKFVCSTMAVYFIPALFAFLISIPARGIFIRVAASMLPEEDESIVPFDRSFGGKVNPAITGGSGCLSVTDAWATFDWPARVRFAKVIGKTILIEMALAVAAVAILVGELMLMGPGVLAIGGPSDPQGMSM
ncbi:uncharacterized protein PFLUO_LOCUS8549 [Penicillium psychrofluorescens]|uniref:uncharacterized protein n=1 Tax=Penicillium psychrofluorescens TaxID=3158075 RepID=UPI003CCD56AC